MSEVSESGSNVIRQCAVTRARRPEDELIRFVLDPENRVTPDLQRRLPGRGVWVSASKAAVAQAVARQAFARAFRQTVQAASDLPELVERLLRGSALQALAMANKAGQVISGFTKVEKAVIAGEAAVLIHASDAAPDGCRKLDGRLKHAAGGPEPVSRIVRCFNSDELGLALGRSNVIHAALRNGGASERFLTAVKRFLSYAG